MKYKDLKESIVFNDAVASIQDKLKSIRDTLTELESITDECENEYFLEIDVFGDIHLSEDYGDGRQPAYINVRK